MVSVVPFGAFVDVAPGRSGLVHVSEYDAAPVVDMTKVAVVRACAKEASSPLLFGPWVARAACAADPPA